MAGGISLEQQGKTCTECHGVIPEWRVSLITCSDECSKKRQKKQGAAYRKRNLELIKARERNRRAREKKKAEKYKPIQDLICGRWA